MKEVELKAFENMGAQMVKEVASQTSDEAGDGTTATVLAQAILQEGLSVVAGMNPMDLKRGIDKAVTAAVEKIKGMATPCEDSKAIAQVGTISANSDEAVGDYCTGYGKVEKEGVITVEEGLDWTTNWMSLRVCSLGYLSFTSSTIKTRCLQSTITRSYFQDMKISNIRDLCHCSKVSRRQTACCYCGRHRGRGVSNSRS